MPRVISMLPKVEECQRIHGPDRSSALFQRIRAVVRDAEPHQLSSNECLYPANCSRSKYLSSWYNFISHFEEENSEIMVRSLNYPLY